MTTLKFWGASDDLIEVEGCTYAIDHTLNEDEQVNGPNNTAEFTVYNDAIFMVTAGRAGQIFVTATYSNLGLWIFSAYQINEDNPYPDDWVTTLAQSATSSYSMELSIDIPTNDNIQIHRVK